MLDGFHLGEAEEANSRGEAGFGAYVGGLCCRGEGLLGQITLEVADAMGGWGGEEALWGGGSRGTWLWTCICRNSQGRRHTAGSFVPAALLTSGAGSHLWYP